MKYYLAAALVSVCQAFDLQFLKDDVQDQVMLGWEDVNFDFANGDDQWLPDHDHIVLTKDCN